MSSLEKKVIDFIRRHDLIKRGSRLLIGVSGGPDSLALLYFFVRRRNDWRLTLSAAHVDHMFRKESLEEMKYVEEICRQWEVPFFGKRIDVPAEVEKRKGNPQDLARQMRYAFFREVMEKNGIETLALAHHGDDQMETMLMRMTRGSSVEAAAGMRAQRDFAGGRIIRPFLCVTKEEIEAYCRKNGLQPVYDPSNEKEIYTRNRFRKHVLPFLKAENRHVHDHFQRLSEFLHEDFDYLETLAKKEMKKIITNNNKERIGIKIPDLLRLPRPLQRRGISIVLGHFRKDGQPSPFSIRHIEAILDLIGGPRPSGELNLPGGLTVTRVYDRCIFHYGFPQETYCFEWNPTEKLALPNGGELYSGRPAKSAALSEKEYFFLDWNNTALPLYVRTRREGDRIRQKGSGGTKKVKEIFIEAKIPIHERNVWPIVTDAAGEILWIPGLKKSSREASGEDGENATVLIYRRNTTTREEKMDESRH